MDLAGAARLARRLHRGEIDEAGRAYVDHLERVAGLVASYGGGGCEQMAAWLHGVSRTGMVPSDLAARRPPRRVVRIVQALTPSPAWESVESYAGRIRSCPGAVLVLRADVTDLCRPEALSALGAGARQRRWDRCRVLLARLGEPVPAGLAEAPVGGPFDVAVLLSQLRADCPGRWAAVQALGSVGELRAAQPLIDAYLAAEAGDPGWAGGKSQLAGALSKIAVQRRHQDDPHWVQRLVSLSAHRDAFLRATAIRGLAGLDNYEPIVVRALSDGSPLVVDAALGALDTRQVQEHAPTLTVIASRTEPEWIWPRRVAVRRLVKAGRADCGMLMTALAADGLRLGHDAIIVLITECGRPVIPQLIGQLRGGARGRAAAAFILGEQRATESAADLAAVLGEDGLDLQVALACIDALAKIADPAAVPALAGAARHRLAWVRAAALTALLKFDHPNVTQIALAACEDFDPDVRERAVRLLAARGDQRATARLLLFCDGPLAPAALKGLIHIADERAVPGLRQVFLSSGDRRIRNLAGQALARSASHAGLLYPGGWMTPSQVRAIAWVLGEIGDKTSSARLSHLLTHRDELVRARAAAALGKIADPATAPALHAALDDISPRVRASAATALGLLGVTDASQWLTPALRDRHPAVRSAAEAALRRLRTDQD